MAIEIIAAPGRAFRTWSMIVSLLLGLADIAYLALIAFGEIEILSPKDVIAINVLIVTLIVPILKLIKQQIPVTTEQKIAVVAAAAAQPMQTGETNIEVKVDEAVVPSTPKDPP